MLFFKSFEWDATEVLIITFQSLIWNFTFLFIDLLFWTLTITCNWWWGIIRNLPDVFPPFITWEWACTRYRGLVGIPSWNGVRNIAPLSWTSSNTTQQLHKNGKNGGCLVSTSQLTSELSTASKLLHKYTGWLWLVPARFRVKREAFPHRQQKEASLILLCESLAASKSQPLPRRTKLCRWIIYDCSHVYTVEKSLTFLRKRL